MYTVFLVGGIASGKSTVAELLHDEASARLIDLDALSRRVLEPGSPCLASIAHTFGSDVLRDGELDRGLLAQRAFATEQGARELEAIELPYIMAELRSELAALSPMEGLCVVQVPLPDRLAPEELAMADEVVAVVCPRDLRRRRAMGRGMNGQDFDARDALQPSEEYLRGLACSVIENAAGEKELLEHVRAWLVDHRGLAAAGAEGAVAHG